MTSKAALLNLLREKGDEQLGHILQLTDHKPHIYKKMLKAKANNVTPHNKIEPIEESKELPKDVFKKKGLFKKHK
jgi:chorismate mutase